MRDAIAASAVFVLCAVLAYLVRPAPERAPELSSPPAPEEPAPPEEPAAPVAPAEPDPAARLQAAIERLPAVEREAASAPIRGRVRMEGGEPVAGARVEARLAAAPARGATLEEHVRAWAEEKRGRATPASAVADAKGLFELRGLVHADYRVEASHPGLWIVPAAPFNLKGTFRPGDVADFVALRGAPYEVDIDVVGPGAGRPEEAAIRIESERAPGASWAAMLESGQIEPTRFGHGFRWTPSRRRLRIAWDVSLVAHGPGGAVSEKAALFLSDPVREVTLRLVEPLGIAIEARLPEGSEKVVSRAAVLRIDPGRPPTLAMFAQGARWVPCPAPSASGAIRDEDGSDRPAITDIPPGTYMVGVSLARRPKREMFSLRGGDEGERRQVDGWTTVEVTEGIARARIEIAAPPTEGGILARVLDPDGALLGDIDFVLWRTDGRSGRPSRCAIDWDRRVDGTYLVLSEDGSTIAALAGAEAASLELSASHLKLGEGRGAVMAGSPAAAVVSFREPGRLEIAVSGIDDARLLDQVRAELRPAGVAPGSPIRPNRAAIDGNVISYDRITPADYQARAVFGCGAGGEIELHSGPLSIGSGGTVRLEVRVPPVHLVVVRMPARRPMGRDICIRGEGVQCRLFSRDERLHLPMGVYEVVVKGRRDDKTETPLLRFEVPGAGEVDIPQEAGR